jgi:hypothetical protein
MFEKFLVNSLLGVLTGKRDASTGGCREAGPERANRLKELEGLLEAVMRDPRNFGRKQKGEKSS